MAYNYNYSPAPHTGQGAFGLVPGNTEVAPSTWSQLSDLYPDVQATGAASLANINNELSGRLSSGTQSQLIDAAAARGVASGMPWTSGNGLDTSRFLQSIGMTSEGLAHQGNQDFLNFSQGIGNMQTNPALATEVAQQNAVYNAAPDPQAAQTYAEQLFQKYSNPAGGGQRGGYSGAGGSGGGRNFSIAPAQSPQWLTNAFNGSTSMDLYNYNLQNMGGSGHDYTVY